MDRQSGNSPDRVGGKRGGNSGDESSASRDVVYFTDERWTEPVGNADTMFSLDETKTNRSRPAESCTQVDAMTQMSTLNLPPPIEDEFTVKMIGGFIIITHVQSRARTKVRCPGPFEYDDNILSCNNECYELKFKNGRIILEAIPEYSETDDENTKQAEAVPIKDQNTGPPTASAIVCSSTDPQATNTLVFEVCI